MVPLRTTLLDTSIQSDNAGDSIIVQSVLAACPSLDGRPRIGTHAWPSLHSAKLLYESEAAIVLGTNVIRRTLWRRRQWPAFLLQNPLLRRKVIYLGVGWGVDLPQLDFLTTTLIRNTLFPGIPIGARDSLTLARSLAAGFPVQHIGCPTMWSLNERLPSWRSVREVVVTLTDYRMDHERDQTLLDLLSRTFRRIYFWPQGSRDNVYLASLSPPKNLDVLPSGLQFFEEALIGRGYVGTRLHGGIRALQLGSPAVIVGVDHRARSISLDTNLPLIMRTDIGRFSLRDQMRQADKVRLVVPHDSAAKWSRLVRSTLGLR